MSGWTPAEILAALTLVGVILANITNLIAIIKGRKIEADVAHNTALTGRVGEAVAENTSTTADTLRAVDVNTALTRASAARVSNLRDPLVVEQLALAMAPAITQAIEDSGKRPAIKP